MPLLSKNHPINPPSLVRQAEDQDARYINAEHEAGQAAQKKSLVHRLNAGRRLNQKKQAIKHGGWEPWLKKNIGFSQVSACRYMKFAKLVDEETKSKAALDLQRLEEIWASTISRPPEEDEAADPDPASDAAAEEGGSEGESQDPEPAASLRRWMALDRGLSGGLDIRKFARKWRRKRAMIERDIILFQAMGKEVKHERIDVDGVHEDWWRYRAGVRPLFVENLPKCQE